MRPRRPQAPSVAAQALLANDGPNILVVTTDDMRWDELAYVPNVRKYVASRGLTFTNSFSPNPLCCPARASFLLGQYSHNHRVYSHEEPYGFGALDDHLTVGTALNKAGYKTALVGKYLNGYGQQPSRVTGGPSRELRARRLDRLDGERREALAGRVAVRRRHVQLPRPSPRT